MDSSGKNIESQQKIHQAVIKDVEDPEMYLFELPGAVDITGLMDKLDHIEDNYSLKDQMEEKFQKKKQKKTI